VQVADNIEFNEFYGCKSSQIRQLSECPVEKVSYDDIQEFIRKLNRKDSMGKYRLPTEAEWEYAARAGTTTPFSFGRCLSTDQANYDGNYPLSGCTKGRYRGKTVSVASFSPNAWGLYDMHGNVWEWCRDWYGDYPSGSVTDPGGPSTGSFRVGRGVGVFWKLPFLPLTLHVGSEGVELSGSSSIATPLGSFGLEATANLTEKERPTRIRNVVVEKKDMLLIIRNPDRWGDKIYKITGGKEISVFTNGQTLILAKNGTIVIDVSKGNVTEVKFAGKQEILGESASGQTVSNKTIPMELKILSRSKTGGIFENLRQGGTICSGDLYKPVFKTAKDAYVYIFNTDDTGKMQRLFPMKAFKGVFVNNLNPVKQGKKYYIPSNSKSFRLDEHAGTGKIRYVALKNPDTKLESEDFENGEASPILKYFDSDAIKSESYLLLREFGAVFQEDLPDAVFVIEGHADSKGTDEYNMKLSRRRARARAVRQFLTAMFQIDAGRLSVRAYGENRPIASNETEDGRSLNRRVEFIREK